jgi:hypothetical protein
VKRKLDYSRSADNTHRGFGASAFCLLSNITLASLQSPIASLSSLASSSGPPFETQFGLDFLDDATIQFRLDFR